MLIVGANLYNKGAESMALIVLNYFRTKFSESEIFLMSEKDYKNNIRFHEDYNVEIIPDLIKILFTTKKVINWNKKQARNFFKSVSIIVDVSGYALGSDWNINSNLNYLLRLKVARRYGIDYYILPQSFGPLNYNFFVKFLFGIAIKHYFSYAKVIYCREQAGYKLLRRLGLKNTILTSDIVLIYDSVQILDKDSSTFTNLDISNSVAIIPNSKNVEFLGIENSLEIYINSIIELAKLGKNVYIIMHSIEDRGLCLKIFKSFENNKNIKFIDKELTPTNFSLLVRKFDYVLASRYHGIVHSYLNKIPVIIFGWAEKYIELARKFNQIDYIIDFKNTKIPQTKLVDIIRNMNKSYIFEKVRINDNLTSIKQNKILDIVVKD